MNVSTTIKRSLIKEPLTHVGSIKEMQVGSEDTRMFMVTPKNSSVMYSLVVVNTKSFGVGVIVNQEGCIRVSEEDSTEWESGEEALAAGLALIDRCYAIATGMLKDAEAAADKPTRIH